MVIYMGVDLTNIVKPKELEAQDLLGKKIAVDSFNWIYQFLSTIRQFDGTPLMDSKNRITSHLSGLFYRNIKLLSYGAKLIYVFDGEKPEAKEETTKKRKERRKKARKEWKEAKQKGDYKTARKKSAQAAQIDDYIIRSSKKLLEIMGIPVVQAKGEGESLCAKIVNDGNAYATASQDYDALLFGCLRLIRNLSISGRKKRGNTYIKISPEIIRLEEALKQLNINKKQLIILGMLVGTDFNPGGVKGIGPKKGLDLVKENSFQDLKDGVEWPFDIGMDELLKFFNKEDKTDYKIKFNKLKKEKLLAFLCDKHDFSSERIESSLNKLKDTNQQQSLTGWLNK